jgi:hypothetical protein
VEPITTEQAVTATARAGWWIAKIGFGLWGRRGRPKALLGMRGRRNAALITFGLVSPDRNNQRWVEAADVMAIARASVAVSKVIGHDALDVRFADAALGDLQRTPNVISIGGPRFNKVTEHLIGYLGSPVAFARTDRGRPSIRTGPDISAPSFVSEGDPDKPSVCFGMIVRVSKPGLELAQQNFTIIAGLSSVSTLAGTIMLANWDKYWERNTQKISKHQFDDSKIAIIYRVSVPAYDENFSWISRMSITIYDVKSGSDFVQDYRYSFPANPALIEHTR